MIPVIQSEQQNHNVDFLLIWPQVCSLALAGSLLIISHWDVESTEQKIAAEIMKNYVNVFI